MTAAVLAAAAAWVWLRPRVAVPVGVRPHARTLVPLVVAGLVLAGLTVGVTVSALPLVLAGVAWGARRLWRQRTQTRLVADRQARVLECCDLLASELAAGQPPGPALARAAETWPLLSSVWQSHALGADVPTALRRAGGEPGAEGLALVAAAWQVSHCTGHGLAEALGRVAQSLRETRSTARVVRGELASARATARLVAGLPLLALLIGSGSGGDPLGFLLRTPAGLACLAAGLALGLAGLGWIERIAADVGR